MNHKTLLPPIFALALCALAMSCSDSESRMPFADAATAVINLAHADAPDQALSVDTPIRSGGMPVGGPLALLDRIKIQVSGPDIGNIEKSFPYSNTVTMDVPPGPMRRFEVTVYTAPYDPDNSLTWSAPNSFQGVTTVNLPAGASVSIPVLMALHDTKIVVPDLLNNRIVQFNKRADAAVTWFTSEDASYHGIPSLYPTDVDFDARGRILIANNPGGSNNIYRIDTIASMSNQPCLMTDESNDIVSIAVDRKRNLLYYATDDHAGNAHLYRIDLTMIPASFVQELDNPSIDIEMYLFYSITALDVSHDGFLYIVGVDDNMYPFLAKYDPNQQEANGVLVGKHFTNTDFFSPLDVMARGGNVYVLNFPGDNPGLVLLDFNFGPSAALGGLGFTLGPHFGNLEMSNNPPTDGFFYGPRKFAARREDTLVIIDEGSFFEGSFHPVDRLIFTDFDPLRPWYAYGQSGSGISQFNFYDFASC